VTQSTDTWASGLAYEAYVGRWSRKVAAAFVPTLEAPTRGVWVDVGCGTGALTAAVLDHMKPVSVLGVDASPAFVQVAAERITDPRVRFEVGDAAALPVENGTVDALVSGLVLNFLPDRPAALAEWLRVLCPGGILGCYVWDYAGEMQLMRHLWDAATALDPAAAELDEGHRSAFCRPEPLRRLAEEAGFAGVRVEAIDVPTVFGDFDDYWTPFLAGTGPAPAYVSGLAPENRERLRALLDQRLPRQPDGTIALVARAWVLRGRRPG
jgi:ubiquinone/menaquinone biosynthesis C-methylase UbiE